MSSALRRIGMRPLVSTEGPQAQLDQQSPVEVWMRTAARLSAIEGIEHGPSSVSPEGTLALLVPERLPARGPEVSLAPITERFEPAHLHDLHDTSLHVVLPVERGNELVELG